MILLLAALALSSVPPPSFEEHLGLRAWHRVDALVEAGRYEEAIAEADSFQQTVVPTAGLHYLVGLSWRRLHDDQRAETALLASVALDPDYVAPWYDLGEIWLVAGRWSDAERAWKRVSELVPAGAHCELGPLRLAEVAAHQRDATAFETHLREALHRGFHFRSIRAEPQWRDFYADPMLRDSVAKMVTVYGDPALLDDLSRPLSPSR